MRDRTHDDDGVLHNDSDEDDDDCDDDTSESESGGRGSGRRRSKGKASRKFRQHVNPLASAYQQPTLLDIDWIQKHYKSPNLPFIIDIGCSKGTWALEMCTDNENTNIVGLEIRKPVVEYALERRDKRGLTNVHFIQTNANVDIERIIKDIQQTSSVEMICIQFPDPHFKAKHKKRRVVNELFVNTLSDLLSKGSKIFLQSDVDEVILDMILSFSLSPSFEIADGYTNGQPETLQLNTNPTPIQTEREISVQRRELPVYRMMFVKT